jgi:hypothetical protein
VGQARNAADPAARHQPTRQKSPDESVPPATIAALIRGIRRQSRGLVAGTLRA